MRIGRKVIQLFGPVRPAYVVVAVAGNGVVAIAVGRDHWPVPLSNGVFQQRHEARALNVFRHWQACEFCQGGVEIEQRDWGIRSGARLGHARRHDEQRHPGRLAPQRFLRVGRLLANVEPVIPKHDDDRVVGSAASVEPVEHPAQHGVHKGNAGKISLHGCVPLIVCKYPLMQLLVGLAIDRSAFDHEVSSQRGVRNIIEVVFHDRREFDGIDGMHVEVLVRHEPGLMRTAKTDRIELRPVARRVQVPCHPVGQLAVRGRRIFGHDRTPIEGCAAEVVAVGWQTSRRRGLARPLVIERRVI